LALLVFIAAICLLLALRVHRLEKRRAAIAKIERLGGHIINLSQWNELPKTTPGFSMKDCDTEIGLLARLLGDAPDMYAIRVYFDNNSQVTDTDLPSLLPLSEIRLLAFGTYRVTDAGLLSIKSLPDLKYLTLMGNPNVTNAGMARFQKALPNCLIER
jgi:hypothetical protein